MPALAANPRTCHACAASMQVAEANASLICRWLWGSEQALRDVASAQERAAEALAAGDTRDAQRWLVVAMEAQARAEDAQAQARRWAGQLSQGFCATITLLANKAAGRSMLQEPWAHVAIAPAAQLTLIEE